MITLSLELSSTEASIALLDDGDIRSSIGWTQSREQGQYVFTAWRRLMREQGMEPDDIDLYVCGRGPGSFSGIRMAITSVQLAARPHRARTIIVSSGESIAAETATASGCEHVVVVGDARRGKRWAGRFRCTGSMVRLEAPWSLFEPDAWPTSVPPGALVVSPDWSRLQGLLSPAERPPHLQWVPRDHPATAAGVARAALERVRQGRPSEPAEPLYLHAAVGAR